MTRLIQNTNESRHSKPEIIVLSLIFCQEKCGQLSIIFMSNINITTFAIDKTLKIDLTEAASKIKIIARGLSLLFLKWNVGSKTLTKRFR